MSIQPRCITCWRPSLQSDIVDRVCGACRRRLLQHTIEVQNAAHREAMQSSPQEVATVTIG